METGRFDLLDCLLIKMSLCDGMREAQRLEEEKYQLDRERDRQNLREKFALPEKDDLLTLPKAWNEFAESEQQSLIKSKLQASFAQKQNCLMLHRQDAKAFKDLFRNLVRHSKRYFCDAYYYQ